jgi:hypothetical protein
MKERKSSRKNNIQERMDREKCRWKDKEKNSGELNVPNFEC